LISIAKSSAYYSFSDIYDHFGTSLNFSCPKSVIIYVVRSVS